MISKEITDKSGYFSDELVDRVDLVLTGLNNVFALLLVFGVALAVFGYDGFDLGDDAFGLVDGLLEAGFLRFYLYAYLYVVLRLLDFVLDKEDDSGALFVFSLSGLLGEDQTEDKEKHKRQVFLIHFPLCLRYIMNSNSIKFQIQSLFFNTKQCIIS